jgi:shikimate kinase
MNIFLIGFRGVGKTTVGKMLAKKIISEFIDADEIIEKRHGFKINEMFERRAESLFRMLESDVINEICKLDSRVIAIGGGAILKYKNVKNIKRKGVIFLLEASVNKIYERIIKDDKANKQKRDRLSGDELLQVIKDLYDFRRPYYQRACDHVIDTSAIPPDTVLEKILDYLRLNGFIPV